MSTRWLELPAACRAAYLAGRQFTARERVMDLARRERDPILRASIVSNARYLNRIAIQHMREARKTVK